jgi:hypothetical protein
LDLDRFIRSKGKVFLSLAFGEEISSSALTLCFFSLLEERRVRREVPKERKLRER